MINKSAPVAWICANVAKELTVTGGLKRRYIKEITEVDHISEHARARVCVCVYVYTHTFILRWAKRFGWYNPGSRGSGWSVRLMNSLFRSISAPSRGVTDRHGSSAAAAPMAGPAFTGAHGTWITSRLREDASSSSSLSSSSSTEKPRKRRAFNLVKLRQPTASGNNNTPFVISGHIKHICSNCSRGNDIRDGEW